MFKKQTEIETKEQNIRIRIFCEKCKKEHFADEKCEEKEQKKDLNSSPNSVNMLK